MDFHTGVTELISSAFSLGMFNRSVGGEFGQGRVRFHPYDCTDESF